MDPENDENEDVEIISTHDEKVKIVGEILSNDSSRKILNLLNASNEMTINEIAQKTGLSLSLVTHHLKRMQSAQVVKVSKVGRSVKGHKMNYYSTTNQSFLIVPSKEPVHSIVSSLKKFSKFFAIGMAGFVSWMTVRTGNTPYGGQESHSAGLRADTDLTVRDESDKWISGSETEFDSDSSKIYYDDFADQESSNPIPQSKPKSEPEPEPEPPHSEMDEFELSEELTTSLENTVRENTGFVSLDSEVYPVPYSSEPLYAVDVDGVFLSIVIPIIVVVAGIVLERVITKWYDKRKIKN